MPVSRDVLVIGAGVMGVGIAQVAAQGGHRVYLYDQRAGAAAQARAVLEKLVAKGKTTAATAADVLERLQPVASLEEARSSRLVIEAIVEQLEPKRALLRELERLLPADAILATNTSSISVTAIAAALQRPDRVVGMHFFNPVPLMALVEVVSGLRTAPAVAQEIARLARAWGKVPVDARSTPGFIVNRIARPYYAEALMLLQEQAAAPEALDALLRGAGFRMGPCELMDLIGHDTNYAVTQSVFEANFHDRRFTPSLVQRELVEGGLFGRKSGRGFYAYPAGAPPLAPRAYPRPATGSGLVVHGSGAAADALHAAATAAREGRAATRALASDWVGLAIGSGRLQVTDGRPAWQLARDTGCMDVAVVDELPGSGALVAFAAAADPAWRDTAAGWLQLLGWTPVEVADTPGLVVARTLAMLVNEAADAVQQGVCTTDGADAAMTLGVNYPAGPFAWLQRLGARRVVAILAALDRCYRGERYRVSPWLQRRAAGAG
jgi:3-hydroxybutyryl-CoA dehydrogenase